MIPNPRLSIRFYNLLTRYINDIHSRRFSTFKHVEYMYNSKIQTNFQNIIHINSNNTNNDIKFFNKWNSLSHRNYSSNVTCRLNWDSHRGLIVDLIRDCDFVALDVEYTGLHMKDERFVGVDKCYESHVLGAKKFIPCQIGLTIAKFENGTWKVTPTSLFTIPSEGKTFSVNMSTLNFLKDNNFDFNNWVRNGICHLTPKEEEDRKCLIVSKLSHLEELSENLESSEEGDITINDYDLNSIQDLEDRHTVESIVFSIERWLSSDVKEPLEFEIESAFLRLLIHSVISIKYPGLYSNSCKKNGLKFVCVYKSQKELIESEKNVLEQELEAINREVGVRCLFDTISKNNKIIVGHNCFYDILHVYQTFYQDLPDHVDNFKKEWLKVFPRIFDTKYISEFYQVFNPQNSLKMLYESMVLNSGTEIEVNTLPGTKWNINYFQGGNCNNIEKTFGQYELNCVQNNDLKNGLDEIKEGQFGKNTKDYEHDAGYDSFMTGMVFIHQLDMIVKSRNSTLTNLINNKIGHNSVDKVIGTVFGEVINSVRLVKCQPSVINMDNEEDMSRHFYMFGFPNAWKKWEIMKIWSPLWVSVSWIDDTSCWIIARNSEDVKNINLIYKMMKNPQFKLYNYGQYLENVHNGPQVAES